MVVPGVTQAGSRTSSPVDLTCLYPTLTKLCSLPVPNGLDGVDIGPLLENPDTQWQPPAIIDYLMGNTAIRTKGWRYIRYAEGNEGEELYDLVSDPNEWTNLATSHQELTKQFKSWLPQSYAEEVPTKGAYEFDSGKYTWSQK